MEASAKCEQWECHATGTEENYEVGSVPQQKVASHFGGWHSWESKKSAVSSFAEQIDYVSHLCFTASGFDFASCLAPREFPFHCVDFVVATKIETFKQLQPVFSTQQAIDRYHLRDRV